MNINSIAVLNTNIYVHNQHSDCKGEITCTCSTADKEDHPLTPKFVFEYHLQKKNMHLSFLSKQVAQQ
jgi:hypothetical protein